MLAGSVVADIVANVGRWGSDLDKAASDAKSFRSKVNRSLAGVDRSFDRMGKGLKRQIRSFTSFKGLLPSVVGGAGIGLLIKSSLDSADAIAKHADKVGLSTAALQELRHAAGKSGVAQQTFDMATQRLSRRIGEAVRGTGELKDTLAQYNIKVRDSSGQTRGLEAIIGDLANTIQRAESDQEALRIAFKAFDSEGAALVNMLRGGEAGLNAMRAEARKFGLVIKEDLLRNAEQTNDRLALLGSILKTTVSKAILTVSPKIGELAQKFADATPKIVSWVEEFSKFIGLVEQSPQEKLAAINQELQEMVRWSRSWWGSLENLTFGDAEGSVDRRIRELLEQRDAIKAEIARAGTEGARPNHGPPGTSAIGSIGPLPPTSLAEPDTSHADRLAELRAEYERIRDSADPAGAAVRRLREEIRKLDEARRAGVVPAAEYEVTLARLRARANGEQPTGDPAAGDPRPLWGATAPANRPTGAELRERFGELQQRYDTLASQLKDTTKQLAELNQMQGVAGVSGEAFGRVVDMVRERHKRLTDAMEQSRLKMSETAKHGLKVFGSFAGGLSSEVGRFVRTGKFDLGSLLRDFAAAQAQMATRALIQKGTQFAMSALLRHGGGTGTSGTHRSVSPGAFVGAPRFHTGFAPDELPAIIKRNETVRTREQEMSLQGRLAGRGGGVVVNNPTFNLPGVRDAREFRMRGAAMFSDMMADATRAKARNS